MRKKIWFKAKEYGWGWYPSTWQGWVILSGYIGVVVWDFIRIDSKSHSVSDTLINFIPETIFLTLVLIAACYVFGEKPGWRWGEKKKH